MDHQPDASDRRTSRRSFLTLVGLAAGAGATTSASAEALPTFRASGTADGSGRQFTIEQGDRCLPVTPLSYGSETITEFYAYSKADYESHTKTGLEASDVSQLFLYEDPDGRLSLGIIHDVAEGSEGTGGAASFSFAGLSGDGDWLVKNDDYDGANEIWETSPSHENDAVHWSWNKWHSDGGVFGGLSDEFDVTIDPAFNGEARLDPGTPGEISEWQFVSGDAENPDRISLDLTEPLTIRTGACKGDGGAVPDTVSARLDVKPGADAVVNPRSRGRLPVAVLSTESFDATTIDPKTIAFGPDGAAPVHVEETDVDGDGRVDLLAHFEMAATGIVVNTTHVTLNARTTDGTRVYGTAELDIVANRDDDEEEREHEAEHEHTETEDEDETERERETAERETEREHEEKETEREHEGKREKREEKREKKREKREKKREKREKKREKREEKREKREEKREKREEKREKRKEKEHDDDDDEDE